MRGNRWITLAALGLACAFRPAGADSKLGDERAGTSSGTFLKIPTDPRGAALGGAFVAGAEGVAAMSWNPAGLASLAEPELMFSVTRWPADIDFSYFAAATYVGRVNGYMGVQFGYLGSVLEETTEEQPSGTGRNFGVRNWYVAVTFARRFTDQLSFGITGRFVREELGTEVGGPSMNNGLVDAGTLYDLRALNMRIAFTIQHFGPEFRPSGTFVSQISGEETTYRSFAPPTVFRLGVSTLVLDRGRSTVRASSEMNHFADAAETVKFGGEYAYDETFFLRAGYDANADALKFSAGAGFHTRFGFSTGDFDYAYTDAGPLGDVHRFAIRLAL